MVRRPVNHVGSQIFALLGGLAAAVGCFMPWYNIGGYVSSGTDQPEGIIILVIGVITVALAVYALMSRKGWLRPLLLLGGLGMLVLGILRAIDIVQEAQTWSMSLVDFVGLGIVVALAGGLVATIAGFTSLRAR